MSKGIHRKPSIKKINSIADAIKEHAYKKGVLIFLDIDGETDEAKIGSLYSFDPKKKILNLILPNIDGHKEKPAILELIRKVHSNGELTLKSTRKEVLESYSKYSHENNKDKELLAYYHPILTSADYTALKMSLYLRYQKNKGKDISIYKKDIRDRFGYRGANISNLCSAGYFDKEFKNLHKSVPKETFSEYYEIAVGKGARALFVNAEMGVAEIEEAFYQMIDKAVQYHLQEFRIHGKGQANVSNIQEFVRELEKAKTGDESYTIEQIYFAPRFPAIEYMVEIKEQD